MKRPTRVSNGFSLVEVTLAIGVAAISLVAIFGLLPVGLQTSHDAIEQNASNDVLSAVIADLRATPPGNATSTQFGISIPGSGGSAVAAPLYFNSEGQMVPSANGAHYRLAVTFPTNPYGPKTATLVDLKMTWPANANPTNGAVGSAETFTALNRN